MAKAVKARKAAPQASRFDGEALGLVLFALGIFLAVTTLLPASVPDENTGPGVMDRAREFLLGWLGWGAYALPIIPVCYGALVFVGRGVRGLTRRVLGGVVVVFALLTLHEVVQPGEAGRLAALSVGPLAGTVGYVAALLPLVLLTIGLEIVLRYAPLTLLKSFFRWLSVLAGGAGTRAQGLIEARQGGRDSARARQDARMGFAASLRELGELRRLYPQDTVLERQWEDMRAAQRTLRGQDEDGLSGLTHDLANWEAMTRQYLASAARDLRATVTAEATPAGAEAEAMQKELSAGRHELSVPLGSTQASGELEVLRRRAVQDLQRLAFRAGRLERERKAAEKALEKADVAVLARETAAQQTRAEGWNELQAEWSAWSQQARHYPGWPDLASAYDRAPTEAAAALAQALRTRPEAALADQAGWRTRLEDVLAGLPMDTGRKTGIWPAPAAQAPRPAAAPPPVLDFDFAPGELPLDRAPATPQPRTAPAPAPGPRQKGSGPTTAPLGSLEALEADEFGTDGDGSGLDAGLGDWDDDDDMPFGPSSPAGRPPRAAPSARPAAHAAPWESTDPEPRGRPAPGAAVQTQLPPAPARQAPQAQATSRQGALPLALPQDSLLDPLPPVALNLTALDVAARQRAGLIDETLRHFGLSARVVDYARGPTVTRYEIEPAPGEKISRIASLSNDLARALAVGGVRVEAPVPGKSVIGLEVPNAEREPVTFHQAADAPTFRSSRAKLPIILGKSIDGELMVGDLAKMPHLLVAGSTGSGKSVCVNTLITSLLFKYLPTELRFLMIDPKMVELTPYDGIPHLVRGVVTNPVDAAGVLLGAVAHMERRYKMMSQVGAKNLEQYNAKMRQVGEVELPHLVIIIDELADLMITSPKEVESAIMRLAQMARATGMHLVLATQRPSVDILTSLIKVNVPARIAFAVSSSHDSRTILDSVGAERLTGMGDMLFYQPGLVKPLRLQGPYISENESARITEELRRQVFEDDFVEAYGTDFDGGIEASGPSANGSNLDFSDPLLRQAAQICIEEGQGSVSRLQRRLSVGHARAGKLMDLLEAMGIVSKHQGSKPREVLIGEAQLPEFFGR
ncbi:DNA translocase FtsK [uncultured Deinococcus sp.]|uniref:DNA translocase FtsK n=1 Tax=uncultured Deinococcus sp. TaxID=158789 RepID=UPI0025830351|nr:DNA translocase FtsK [uncultured Deinococcus sp.]